MIKEVWTKESGLRKCGLMIKNMWTNVLGRVD